MVQREKTETFETSTKTAINYNKNTELLFEKKIVPELIPTRLAADILGISENALRIKVCRGSIPAQKFGRHLRFQVSEIVSLLQPKE